MMKVMDQQASVGQFHKIENFWESISPEFKTTGLFVQQLLDRCDNI